MPYPIEQSVETNEPSPNQIRWTRAQCDAICDANILTGRYELIDGQIISKKGSLPPRAYVVQLITGWLAGIFGWEFVRCQLTIDVSRTSPLYDEPEPDIVVTSPSHRAFADRHPAAADILLLVEVSEPSARFDLTKKASLYARCGITDYWVVDLPARRVVVHRLPSNGRYLDVVAYGSDESVSPIASPSDSVRVDDLLPPTA